MANKLGANGYVGGAIGASLLEPNYTNLVAQGAQDVSFLGIPVIPSELFFNSISNLNCSFYLYIIRSIFEKSDL